MQGTRNLRDGLYDIPINKKTLQENNYVEPELKGYTTLHKKNPSVNSVIQFSKK